MFVETSDMFVAGHVRRGGNIFIDAHRMGLMVYVCPQPAGCLMYVQGEGATRLAFTDESSRALWNE